MAPDAASCHDPTLLWHDSGRSGSLRRRNEGNSRKLLRLKATTSRLSRMHKTNNPITHLPCFSFSLVRCRSLIKARWLRGRTARAAPPAAQTRSSRAPLCSRRPRPVLNEVTRPSLSVTRCLLCLSSVTVHTQIVSFSYTTSGSSVTVHTYCLFLLYNR